jgi:hypothetical protein
MLFAFGGRVKGVRRSNSCQRAASCALANRKISRLCDQLSGHRSIRFYHAREMKYVVYLFVIAAI